MNEKVMNGATIARISEQWAADFAADIGQQVNEPEPIEGKPELTFDIGTNSLTNLLFDIFALGTGVNRLQELKNRINHGKATYSIITNKDNPYSVTICYRSANATWNVNIPDTTKLNGNNKNVKKIFVFMLKLIARNTYNGELASDQISFPLHQLVEYGAYSNVRTARKGFDSAMDALTDLKISGTLKHGKTVINFVGAQPFGISRIINGQCIIKLFNGKEFNWIALTEYFTILPSYYFQLTNRAADLLVLIFCQARQNKHKIAKGQPFVISNRYIQQRLGLPDELGNDKPYQTIIKPIQEAVSLIEDMNGEYFCNGNAGGLQLLEVGYDGRITDVLDNGYLQVTLKGDLAEPFRHIDKLSKRKHKPKNNA